MKFSEYPYLQAAYYSKGRKGVKPTIIVLHYTAGRGDGDKLAKFFAGGSRKASAHFGVSRKPDKNDDSVWQCVDTDDNAWHPGKSLFMDGKGNLGVRSIGIEICNVGWNVKSGDNVVIADHRNPASSSTKWEAYTDSQIAALEELIGKLVKAYPTLQYVTGHEDIRNKSLLPELGGSKTDPGPAFPWDTVNLHGLEQWHFSFKRKLWYAGQPTD